MPADIRALELEFAKTPTIEACIALCEAYLASQRFMEAMVVCKKGMKSAPADPRGRVLLARVYLDRLAGVGDLRFPPDRDGDECVYHQMTVATSRRDALAEHLKSRGVGSSVHYPSPLHRQAAMAELLPAPPLLPVAERAAAEVLCLPMFAELELDEAARAADEVAAFFGG